MAGGLLHQPTTIEHGDSLAPAAGHGEVVTDQQQGAAGFLTQAGQLGHHLARHRHIQAGGGFIGDHQGGAQGQGQGDRQALAHAAAEFVGIAAVAGGIDAHPLQQLPGPLSLAAPLPCSEVVGGQGVA